MPQRASVFCNFYIRVDREALVSERALDVGSVAFKAMSTKIFINFCVICLCYIILCEFGTAISKKYACFCCLFKIIMSGLLC
jgi:hypothetical protein